MPGDEKGRMNMNYMSEEAAHTFAWREMLPKRDGYISLLRALKTWRWFIALFTIALTIATTVAVFQIKPRYTATAKLLLDPQSSRFNNSEAPVLPSLLVDREVIESEMQILSSRKLASTAVDKLGLTDDPDFNTQLAPRSALAFVQEPLDRVRAWIGGMLGKEDARSAGVDEATTTKAKVVDAFAKAVSVQREGQSRVISVSVETTSPTKSAQIANTLSELYFLDHIENLFAQRQRMANWLDQRLTEFKLSATASQKAVEDYRRQAGLFSTRDETGRRDRIDAQQLTQISSQLISARSDRAALEARLRTVERMDKGNERDFESVPEVMSNPVIASLRAQEARVLQRSADLQTEFGPRHPSIIAAKSELQDIRSNIQKEIARVIASLRNEVDRARAREAVLQDTYKEMEGRNADQNSREIKLAELSREADVNQRILEQFLEQFKEVSAKQAFSEPEARVVAQAEPPVVPSYPKRGMTIVLAFVGWGLLASGLAVLMDRTNSRFRTSEEVEEATGLPVLTVMPKLQSGWRAGLARELLEDPPARVSEALHTLAVGLISRGFGETANRVLFTSSFPGEGKSSLAFAFGRALARQGKNVVLVDADFRRPQLSKTLALADRPGLSDYLRGRTALSNIVQHPDPSSSMRIVGSGSYSGPPSEFLEVDVLTNLLNQLSSKGEYVVIDSPPVLVVPDALMLCRLVDHTLLVTRWNQTSREDVAKTVKTLRESGATLTGIILNAVNISKYAAYSYRDAKTYMRAYARYYT